MDTNGPNMDQHKTPNESLQKYDAPGVRQWLSLSTGPGNVYVHVRQRLSLSTGPGNVHNHVFMSANGSGDRPAQAMDITTWHNTVFLQ